VNQSDNNVGSGNNNSSGAIIGAVVWLCCLRGYIGSSLWDKQAQRIEQKFPGAEVTRSGRGFNVVFNEDAGRVFWTLTSLTFTGTSASLPFRIGLVGIFKRIPRTLNLSRRTYR